jgi:predicted DNA-binding ribbon-helix-helix protein
MVTKNSKGKSNDKRDRFSVTFDIGGLRTRLMAQASEPNQSLASIIRMAVLEWLADREALEKDREAKSKSEDAIKSD